MNSIIEEGSMSMKNSNISKAISNWQGGYLSLYFHGALVGIITGFVVVLYRILLNKSSEIRVEVFESVKNLDFTTIIPGILVFAAFAWVLGRMIDQFPMIKGSGIPQVKGVLLRQFDFDWLKELVLKFIGGVMSLASGMSLGREGPSVQLGSEIGKGFFQVFKRPELEKKYLITSGASAGLAAAFNAPLAGVIFSLEELHKNFSPVLLTCIMISSLFSDMVSRNFFGLKPVFNFDVQSVIPLNSYFYLAILGVLTGVFGKIFNISLLKFQDFYSKFNIKPKFRPLIPIAVSFILCIFLSEVTGGGHHLIEELSRNDFQIKFLLLLLIVKFLFTLLCYGSGVPGGIFLPLLVVGALIGNIYANVLVNYFSVDPAYTINFIILAMAAFFTAVVRAPITGSVLILEMTGSFSHLLSLTLVSMVAFLVTEFIDSKPIYDLLLDRMLEKPSEEIEEDVEEHEKISEDKMITLFIPVCSNSGMDDKMIKELNLPCNCLIVGVKRGEDEVIPNGATRIMGGDYLIVLASQKKARKLKPILLDMGSAS